MTVEQITNLPNDSQRIIYQVIEATGKDIIFVPDTTIAVHALALILPAQATEHYHVLRFLPEYADQLGYFVAHEGGHLLRLYSVPAKERMLMASTPQTEKRFMYRFQNYFRQLLYAGAQKNMEYTFDLLYGRILHQLQNIPADMRIERWIRENYPGLSEMQNAALQHQAQKRKENISDPVIRNEIHPEIHRVIAIMETAFIIYLGWLLKDKALEEPFGTSSSWMLARKLAQGVWESKDQGHIGDRATSDEWARILSLKKMYEWVDASTVKRKGKVTRRSDTLREALFRGKPTTGLG